MIKKENFDVYFNLIEELVTIFEELESYFDYPSEQNFLFFEDTFEVFKDMNKEVEIDSGCTKGVIIHKDLDYVIKLPFLANHEMDYCNYETIIYEEARQRGVDIFFSPCYQIGEYRGVPIYIMKKAKVDGREFKKIGIDIYKKTHRVSKDVSDKDLYREAFYGYNNRRLVKYLFQYYYIDTEGVAKLVDFLDEKYINDIHAYNIGIIENKIVLIDYSGI